MKLLKSTKTEEYVSMRTYIYSLLLMMLNTEVLNVMYSLKYKCSTFL